MRGKCRRNFCSHTELRRTMVIIERDSKHNVEQPKRFLFLPYTEEIQNSPQHSTVDLSLSRKDHEATVCSGESRKQKISKKITCMKILNRSKMTMKMILPALLDLILVLHFAVELFSALKATLLYIVMTSDLQCIVILN